MPVPEGAVSLIDVFGDWGPYQEKIASVVAPLTAEQLTLRAAPHMRSIGEIATHMIAVRVRWFQNIFGGVAEDVQPLGAWDRATPDEPPRTADELAAGFAASWGMIEQMLSGWTAEDLAEVMRGTWHGEPYEETRRWVIWHVLEHDLHHGGELSLTLGIHGLDAPDM